MSSVASSRVSSVSEVKPPISYDDPPEPPEKRFFAVYILAVVLVILACVMVGIKGGIEGGFAWNGTINMFHYHPLFMTIGLLLTNGQALLLYRILRHHNLSYTAIKSFHLIFQLFAFIFSCCGLHAVFTYIRHQPGKYNLSESHGWLGFIIIIMFTLQMICGFGAFVFPGASRRTRVWYIKYHRFFGTAILLISCAEACMGMALYQTYGWGIDAILSRVYVLAVVCYGVCMGYLISDSNLKSPQNMEESAISKYQNIITPVSGGNTF